MERFEGLEQLNIAFDQDKESESAILLWNSVASHKATLTSFVYHSLAFDHEDLPLPEEIGQGVDILENIVSEDLLTGFYL